MFLFYKLNQAIYPSLSSESRADLAKAFLFAADAHETQTRSSGEPYITHPVAVTCLLSQLHTDRDSLLAALLHDTIEDTPVTRQDIVNVFGEKTAELVEGVTKLTQIECRSKVEEQAENIRKMILAMVHDIRVIFIKLADRLHNMSTLMPLRPDKRRRIAQETLDIYAPIAHRLGIHHFKNKFEDYAFEGIYPLRYRILKERVTHARKQRYKLFNKILEKLRKNLSPTIVDAKKITGRQKHLYSIYRKMRDRGMVFSEVMDLYGYKVVTNQTMDCYQALGIVHSLFKPIPGRFKDYIASPKANGYQALHTTVFGPYGVPIEVQIKTKQMDLMAERGVAAHWLYKSETLSQSQAQKWLEKLSDLQQQAPSSVAFVESVKLDLFPDEVYVFTPQGEVIELPRQATCVDFAYHIHTDVGHHSIAAKINHKVVPLHQTLTHGDTVEIITDSKAEPDPSWLKFVKTSRAKHAIKSAIKQYKTQQAQDIGQEIINRQLRNQQIDLANIDKSRLQQALVSAGCYNMTDLYQKVGLAEITPDHFIAHLTDNDTQTIEKQTHIIRQPDGQTLCQICCPVPQDAIMGQMVPQQGLVIHRLSCPELQYKQANQPVSVSWQPDQNATFQVKLYLTLKNQKGAIAQITKLIADQQVTLSHLQVHHADQQLGYIEVIFEVSNKEQLDTLKKHIQGLDICIDASRKPTFTQTNADQ